LRLGYFVFQGFLKKVMLKVIGKIVLVFLPKVTKVPLLSLLSNLIEKKLLIIYHPKNFEERQYDEYLL